jgi:ribosomal-protein-alanine N-acetyltransferase
LIAAGLQHDAALAAIHAAAFPHDPWPASAFRSLLQQPGVAGFLDSRGGLVLFRCVADEAEILTIGAAVKRQGIGRALLTAAITQVKVLGVTTLHLEVAASNIAALDLYAALGFQQTGKRPNYYPDGDALILSLRIQPD